MYLSVGYGPAIVSFSLAGNDVIWSAHLRSPGYTRRNLAEQVEIHHYERNVGAQKHFQPFNQDGDSRQDNKHKHLKGAMAGQK